MSRIEVYDFLIRFYSVSNIRSFYFSFSGDIRRVYYIDYFYTTFSIYIDDFFCMSLSIRSTCFSCEEDSDILHIYIVICDDREYVLLYDIVGFCIYRYDDDMFDIFSSFLECFII